MTGRVVILSVGAHPCRLTEPAPAFSEAGREQAHSRVRYSTWAGPRESYSHISLSTLSPVWPCCRGQGLGLHVWRAPNPSVYCMLNPCWSPHVLVLCNGTAILKGDRRVSSPVCRRFGTQQRARPGSKASIQSQQTLVSRSRSAML